MEQHIRILAVLYIVLGALGVLIGLGMFAIVFGAGAVSGDREAMLITGTVGAVIAGLCLVLSVPSIIAGVGLQRRRSWARILAIVIAALNLFNVPIGTAIGVYALWALLNEQSKSYFASGAQTSLQ